MCAARGKSLSVGLRRVALFASAIGEGAYPGASSAPPLRAAARCPGRFSARRGISDRIPANPHAVRRAARSGGSMDAPLPPLRSVQRSRARTSVVMMPRQAETDGRGNGPLPGGFRTASMRAASCRSPTTFRTGVRRPSPVPAVDRSGNRMRSDGLRLLFLLAQKLHDPACEPFAGARTADDRA